MTKRFKQLTEEQKELIIERVSEGDSLRKICDWNKIDFHSVTQELRENEEFNQQYAIARETQADVYAEKIVDELEKIPPMILDQFGNSRIDPAWSAIQRNKIDALKWTASKLKPRIYGDSTTLKGDKDNPLANFGAILDAVSRRIEDRKAKALEIEQKPAMIDITPDSTTEETPI